MLKYKLIDTEVRVLGCLIEKDMTTPEYYPLSLNSLLNACNQKSNRFPVVTYDEKIILQAINELKDQQLVYHSDKARVVKYAHSLDKKHNLIPNELAIIALLLLRGQQTPGELRGRSERLYNFNSLDEINKTLKHLDEIGFIEKMTRQPGHKESRYAHLLSGSPQLAEVTTSKPVENPTIIVKRKDDRMEKLENLIHELQAEIATLKTEFRKFKSEFE